MSVYSVVASKVEKYDLKSDSSAVKKLMPEVCKNADPAVTETDIRCSEKPLDTLFDCVDENKITAKAVVPVRDDAVPACSNVDPVKIKIWNQSAVRQRFEKVDRN